MSALPDPNAPRPSAVVFDCDGTIADTEPMTARVFDEVLARYGYQLVTGDIEEIIGRTLRENHAYLCERVELPPYEAFSDEWYRESYAMLDVELELFDDAVGVLRTVADRGIPVAVASSSPREHVRRVLARGGLEDAVRAVVAYEDVEEHKPQPVPYLRAAQLLGVDPRATVAIEDTGVGIAAAQAAGMYCIGIVRDGIDPRALAAADRVVHRLSPRDVLVAPTGPATRDPAGL